ncbi:MAG: mannose-1-phosphate guanylyltransferase [Porticoccaceae bacterium]|nr:mannose-1-phosphate guanylyltransferase [Porticoccaceae bacterium]
MRAMILAAGLGYRMRPLTLKIPKPMLPIAGKPVLQHHIERLAKVGVRELIINTHWLAHTIEDYFKTGETFGVSIMWSRESHLLDTGGAVVAALPALGADPFLLLNGDIWTDYPLERLVENGLGNHIDAHLVLVENPEDKLTGDFSMSRRKVTLLNTDVSLGHTFAGLSLWRPEIFAKFKADDKPFPLKNILNHSVKLERVTGELYMGNWCDIGDLSRYKRLLTQT